jgi:thiol-disulfide isomerase/thioredoxin
VDLPALHAVFHWRSFARTSFKKTVGATQFWTGCRHCGRFCGNRCWDTPFFLPFAEVWDFTQPKNQSVPPFKLKTLDQEVVTSSELKGKVLVLDFWATWCAPCIKQFPEVERLQKKYQDNSNVYVAAVNTSWENSMDQARSFTRENSLDIKVLYDIDGELAENLSIKSIPHTVIIGKNQNLRVRHAGFTESMDYVSIMSRYVNELLNE